MAEESKLYSEAVKGFALVNGVAELHSGDKKGEGAAAGAAAHRVGLPAVEGDDIGGLSAADEGFQDEVGGDGVGVAEVGVEEEGAVNRSSRGAAVEANKAAGDDFIQGCTEDDEETVGSPEVRERGGRGVEEGEDGSEEIEAGLAEAGGQDPIRHVGRTGKELTVRLRSLIR